MIIHGKEYTEVKDRLKAFWAKMSDEEKKRYSGLAVVTEMLWKNDDLSALLFRATVLVNGQVAATGHAYEERTTDAKQVNATSWVENCETSAIGRALANMDIVGAGDIPVSVTPRPSAEEMQKVERMAGSTGPKKFLKLPVKPNGFIEQAGKVREGIKNLIGHDRPVIQILAQHNCATLEEITSRATQEEVFVQLRDFLNLWQSEVDKASGKTGSTFRDLDEAKREEIAKKMELLLV